MSLVAPTSRDPLSLYNQSYAVFVFFFVVYRQNTEQNKTYIVRIKLDWMGGGHSILLTTKPLSWSYLPASLRKGGFFFKQMREQLWSR